MGDTSSNQYFTNGWSGGKSSIPAALFKKPAYEGINLGSPKPKLNRVYRLHGERNHIPGKSIITSTASTQTTKPSFYPTLHQSNNGNCRTVYKDNS